MSLSLKLLEILKLMNDGWQLGRNKSSFFSTRKWWLQQGGCGYGGDVKNFHRNINVHILCEQNLIKSDGYGFPTETYHLTERGKQFLTEL